MTPLEVYLNRRCGRRTGDGDDGTWGVPVDDGQSVGTHTRRQEALHLGNDARISGLLLLYRLCSGASVPVPVLLPREWASW